MRLYPRLKIGPSGVCTLPCSPDYLFFFSLDSILFSQKEVSLDSENLQAVNIHTKNTAKQIVKPLIYGTADDFFTCVTLKVQMAYCSAN